jgi:NAD(P)H dehydrogenase (quinone)
MKIAVTAANGKLGSAVVRALLELVEKSTVVALARTPAKAASLGVEARPGDYNDKNQFIKALSDIDAVLLISGLDAPEKRITLHRNVISAAKESGVEKIVYSSIVGAEKEHGFRPIVESNRQTEKDIRNSGLEFVIGRNGIYIEPDVEYIDKYVKAGKIVNSAQNGKCAYATRHELAAAYAKMLLQNKHHGQTYNLVGEAITQTELATYLNRAFDTNLLYESTDVETYRADRIRELGTFYGNIVGGIYEGIRQGYFDVNSDYAKAAGREHVAWKDYFSSLQ